MQEKLVIISAPSGAGKSTIVGNVLPELKDLEFSISATSRAPRGEEKHGKHYYFLSPDAFREAIKNEDFLEWEEVYPDQFYGSLKSEVTRLWGVDKAVIFDIDVVGALNLKKQFGDKSIAIFIEPPTFDVLEQRLRGRGTETEEKIQIRLGKAKEELSRANEFDYVVVNDDLEKATREVYDLVHDFLNN
ncbi:guanylate kinase [bacterium SCSIO 12643]|nr:guanylate kinase [bacterium SCSIO 12643]